MTEDELMTSIDGVRVRLDEESRYRARHKAQLSPTGGAVSTPKARPKRAGKAGDGDNAGS